MIPTHGPFQRCQHDRVIWPGKRRAMPQLLAHICGVAVVCGAHKLLVSLKLCAVLIRPKLSFIWLVAPFSFDLCNKPPAIGVNEMQRDLIADGCCFEEI